jgi:hypothetical protein
MREKKYLIINSEDKHPLTDAIKREVFGSKINYAIIITGPTQWRKSTSGIRIAMDLDDDFSFEKDFAIIKTKDMIKAFVEGTGRGKVKLLDEVGTGLDHHTWFQFIQRAMSYIMQTGGFEGKIVIMIAPFEDLVNKDILKFFNMKIKIIGKDEKRKYAIGKVLTLEYDEQYKDVLRKYPRTKDGRQVRFVRIHFPPNEVMKKYFSIANPSKKDLQYELLAEATKIEASKSKLVFTAETYVQEILRKPDDFIREYNRRKFIPIETIMNKFGFGNQRAKQIKDEAEKRLSSLNQLSTASPTPNESENG